MNRWRLWTALLAVTAATACATQEDYTSLRAEFEYLRTKLVEWSGEVYDWQTRTFVVICDIKVKNVPETPYATETNTYCGPAEGGEPEPPPDWGPPQE